MADPFWRILRHQGRDMRWLSQRTATSYYAVRRYSCGQTPAPPAWRARAAAVLDLPEEVCWLPRPTAAAPAPELSETAA